MNRVAGLHRPTIHVFAFVLLVIAENAIAQDAHYSTQQYGTQSTLLGGQVIGSVGDISAVFYNPGRLGLLKNAAFLLGANAFEVQRVTFETDGPPLDLGATNVTLSASIIAGSVPVSWWGSAPIAYSYLVRQRYKVRLEGWGSDASNFDPSGELPGLDGRILAATDLREEWYGITWAKPLRDKLGVGVSTFVAYRTQKNDNELLLQDWDDSAGLSQYQRIFELNYNNYRLLWKLGTGFNVAKWDVGINVTTPSINLLGRGKYGINGSWTGVPINADSAGLVSDFQEDMKTTYKSSWGVGAGASYDIKKWTLHFSVEWYDAVGRYDVMEPDPFIAQSTGDTLQVPIQQALTSVTNFGLGLEWARNERFHGYGSFRTDFSADPQDGPNVSTAPYDLYHVTMGALFFVKRSEFTGGIEYAWGSAETDGLHQNSGADDNLPNPDRSGTIKYTKFQFIIGFSIDF